MQMTAKQITKLRESAGLTQRQLADAIGVTYSYVCHFERGSRKASAEMCAKITRACKRKRAA